MDFRWVAYAGSAALAAVSLMPTSVYRPDAVPAPARAVDTRPRPESTQPLIEVQRRTARLSRYRTEAPQPNRAARDPFRYALRSTPAAQQVTPAEPTASPVVATSEPASSDANMRLVGIVTRGEADQAVFVAVITDGRELHLVRRGERIAGRYVVTSVEADTAVLSDETTATTLQLALPAR